MNMKIKLCIAVIGLMAISCEREIGLSPGLEEFDVTTEKHVYKIDEDVIFNITGDPDMISFYSGELYSEYAYRDERVIDLQKTLLSFSSANPVLSGAQVSDFRVLVSTDFNDVYTYENLVNAHWTDITSKFSYGVSTTYVPSGNYEISELYEAGRPLYVAFRYINKSQEEYGVVRRFLIQSFQMIGQSIYGDHLIGDPVSSDFRLIEKSEDARTASSLTTTTITLNGYPRTTPSADPDPATDTWAVTKAFDLDMLDNGPDRPVALKGNQDPKLRSHVHSFSQPGEYTVTFIGINANIGGSKEIVKQIKITVVEPD